MATYDPQHGWIVVRIVYDGAAFAGKTTSLRALAESLGRPVFSGEEAEGRTLYLDWVDFIGGRFEGSPIRCQIVAVPGQVALASRRSKLLADADAVVLVADSTPIGHRETLRSLASLRAELGRRDPPVGMIIQLNKRDSPHALTLREIEQSLGDLDTVALAESVASEGRGIRETFVFAVRLALDRVRELEHRGTLPREVPEIDSGEGLLAALRAAEALADASPQPGERGELTAASRQGAPAQIHISAESLLAPRAGARAAIADPGAAGNRPRLPTSQVPSGGVWPPVEGRMVLHEAERNLPLPRRTRRGDWFATGERWRWHSANADLFDDRDAAHEGLLAWARWHVQAASWLSAPRAIALCEATPGSWRLWQVVARVPTYGQRLRAAQAANNPRDLADRLWEAARALVLAERELVAPGALHRLGLDVLAEHAGHVVYTGLAPHLTAPRRARPAEEPSPLLRRHLAPRLARCGFHRTAEVPRVLDRILERSAGGEPEGFAEALAAIVIGH